MGDAAQGPHAAGNHRHGVHRVGAAGDFGPNIVVAEHLDLGVMALHQLLAEVVESERLEIQLIVENAQGGSGGNQVDAGNGRLGDQQVQQPMRINGSAGPGDGKGDLQSLSFPVDYGVRGLTGLNPATTTQWYINSRTGGQQPFLNRSPGMEWGPGAGAGCASPHFSPGGSTLLKSATWRRIFRFSACS